MAFVCDRYNDFGDCEFGHDDGADNNINVSNYQTNEGDYPTAPTDYGTVLSDLPTGEDLFSNFWNYGNEDGSDYSVGDVLTGLPVEDFFNNFWGNNNSSGGGSGSGTGLGGLLGGALSSLTGNNNSAGGGNKSGNGLFGGTGGGAGAGGGVNLGNLGKSANDQVKALQGEVNQLAAALQNALKPKAATTNNSSSSTGIIILIIALAVGLVLALAFLL